MPTRGSKNVRARYLELPADLDAAVDAFAKSRGQTFKAVIVEACQRHLAYPPPPPVPLPPPAVVPLPDAASPVKPKRGKK